MEVLWLKSQKIPHQKICQLAGISPNTLLTYLRDYQEGGIEKLKEINFYRPKSELESQRETLKKYFEKNPPATINEAVYRREELTGIKRSPTQVSKFLKSMLIKCLKVGSLPSNTIFLYSWQVSYPPLPPRRRGRVDSFKLSTADFESINVNENSQVYLFLTKIVSHNN